MYCTKCGKQNDDSAVFCESCGAPLGEPSAVSDEGAAFSDSAVSWEKAEPEFPAQPPKKRGSKKAIAILAVLVLLAVGGALGVRAYRDPHARMDRALRNGDLDLAYEIFDENFRADDLSEEELVLLQEGAARVQEQYLTDAISYEDALENLDLLRAFEAEGAEEAISQAAGQIQSQHQIETQLENAQNSYQAGKYTDAITAYQAVLEEDPANADAASGVEQAKEAYLDDVLAQVENQAAQGAFTEADSLLATAEALVGEDTRLSDAQDSLHDQQIEQMAEEARTAAEGGDWDGALEILDTYEAQYPDEQVLEDAREEITREMPITLKNLTLVSSSELALYETVISDRWDHIYDGAVRYEASNDAFGLYNLNKAYTTFTGTVVVPPEASNGKDMSFAIYIDEELVYYQEHITEETPPISFEIDVTDATTMRITTSNAGTYSNGGLLFVDTNFAKVESGQSA